MQQLHRYLFRMLLPVLFVGLTVGLIAKGESDRDRLIVALGSSTEHGVPDYFARASFVAYAINAPAWAAAWSTPPLWSRDVDRWNISPTRRRMIFFGYLACMWFAIGSYIDVRKSRKLLAGPRNATLARLVCGLICCYGIFMCYTAIKFDDWYEVWFIYAIFIWGATMAAGGGIRALIPMNRRDLRLWREALI